MITTAKRKLLFEHHPGDDSLRQLFDDGTFARKVDKLCQNKVKTIFVITSGEILLDPYLEFIGFHEDHGFNVISIQIDALDNDHLVFVRNAVEEINASFRKGGCLIVSFGESVAGAVLTCFYIYSGRSLNDSLEKVRVINDDLMRTDEEVAFVRDFHGYLGFKEDLEHETEIQKSIIEKKNKKVSDDKKEKLKEEKKSVSEDLKQTVIIEEEKSKKKDQKKKKKEKIEKFEKEYIESGQETEEIIPDEKKKEKKQVEEDEESFDELHKIGSGVTHFYSSIRFKLISIISIIIIVSLSGMIFLASYFFKKDNTIRVQENNLNVSEVIALKIDSDFKSIINKSKLIANALMQNISKRELNNYTKLILHNDRDFIFFGMALASKRSRLKFVKTARNDLLMEETQITNDDIILTHKANREIFKESFDGETVVVHNVSAGFRTPAIGLSLPFHKDIKGRTKSILICYVKLDKFLEAFQISGITKTYMVNDKGDIIAHADTGIVLGGGNYINLPIVKSMIKSELPNGQQRFKDENGVFHLGSFKKIGIGGCGVIATVDENVAYQEVNNQQRRNIYLTVIVLTIVILIIFFFAKTITTPIIRLLGATKKIKEGDYNVKIRPAYNDEIGELTNSFIEMGKGLEEREKIKTAFGKFVNPEIAEMVSQNEVQLGGEIKKVAILFSDIRNFTSMSENLEPEEVVEFLNAYMTEMVGCIDRTGGIVDKFIGDAIMAEWGVPVSRGNDTENAINGTVLMRKALIEFNKDRGGERKPIIKIGCGINTGQVLSGQIGSENRMEYTVIGDAVNLASRIEALNKPFGTDILISQDSYEYVKEIFAVEKMSPIRVKGKEDAQQIYAILGRQDDPERPKTIQELRVILGTSEQPFRRRREDRKDGEGSDASYEIDITEEVKYEIIK